MCVVFCVFSGDFGQGFAQQLFGFCFIFYIYFLIWVFVLVGFGWAVGSGGVMGMVEARWW